MNYLVIVTKTATDVANKLHISTVSLVERVRKEVDHVVGGEQTISDFVLTTFIIEDTEFIAYNNGDAEVAVDLCIREEVTLSKGVFEGQKAMVPVPASKRNVH